MTMMGTDRSDTDPGDATPEVTVVICTHNRRDIVVNAIHGALDQRGVDVQVIVVDDGSTDGTSEMVDRDFVKAGRPVQVIRREVAKGVGAARNVGLRAARTRWVALSDDDDLWAPDKLLLQMTALAAQDGARWSAVGCVTVDRDLQIVSATRLPAYEDLFTMLLEENFIPGSASSVLIDRDLALEIGGFDEACKHCEDWDMWLRVAQRAPLAYVDQPLMAYRTWGGTMSRNFAAMERTRTWVRERHGGEQIGALTQVHDVSWQEHQARAEANAGSRLGAARHYVAAAFTGRRWGQLLYAGAALISPRLVRSRLDRVDQRRVPEDWRAAADAWLEPWRERS